MGKEKGGGFVFGGGEVKERQESIKKSFGIFILLD